MDFKELRSINSIGIKKLANLLKDMKPKQFIYKNCPPFFIDQINMFSPITEGVKILSFGIPLICESCDINIVKYVDTQDALTDVFINNVDNQYPCPQCTGYLELEEDETIYFSFLKHLD